jgi:hypothetical protein
MAFCPPASAHEEAGLLLVGTEGGQLLRCQVRSEVNPQCLGFGGGVTRGVPTGFTLGAAEQLHSLVPARQ